MALKEGQTPWFHFDPVLFLPLWIGIWRWGAYLILKGIPSLLYKPIPISEELEQGHVPVSTQMMTMIIPVYMPEPGFEECLQSWVDNRPKTIVIVVDTNSYQQVRREREFSFFFFWVENITESPFLLRMCGTRQPHSTNSGLPTTSTPRHTHSFFLFGCLNVRGSSWSHAKFDFLSICHCPPRALEKMRVHLLLSPGEGTTNHSPKRKVAVGTIDCSESPNDFLFSLERVPSPSEEGQCKHTRPLPPPFGLLNMYLGWFCYF